MAQVILHPREGRSPKDYALMYAGLGWKVFPVWGVLEGTPRRCACPRGAECDRPGKHPIGDLVPSGVSDASSERGKIEAWWSARPEASIGIATGRVSDLTVIDADATDGKPGLINLTRLCAERGGVPSTFTVQTGGGGLHLYFRYNRGLGTGTNVLDAAIDVRSDGGYVIAPPSGHILGEYKWREDRAELRDLPEWMITAPQEAREREGARRRGRPRVREALPLEKTESMLAAIDSDDRDRWLKIGLLLGRMYVGTPGEAEAWTLYENWAARSEKFDEDRAANITRMREQFFDASQAAPRAGGERLGVGTLVLWAKEGGWTPFGERVVVAYEAGNEAKMTAELVQALVADAERNRFFNVMGEVRDVLRCVMPSMRMIQRAVASGEQPPETLVVRRTTAAGLQCALSEAAVISVISAEGVPIAKPIPNDFALMILKDRANDFPTLSGVAEWPMVMEGAVIARQRGYDAATGLFFDIAESVRVDEAVTAEQGWAWLRDEFLGDFPFENDLHRAGALGMMLAFMLRPLMKTCPAFAVVAPQPGTGKSTLIEVISIAVHGFPVASHAFSQDEEELRKALHSLMIAKTPAVMFDNVGRGRAIASDHLAKMITSETATDRTLGSSETRKEVNSLLMTFTGNNIAFVRDMASRVVTLRLNARAANPLSRRFAHPDIRRWASSARNRVLSALIAIGKLADGERLPAGEGAPSRFEDYEAMIVAPVLAVTGQDLRKLEVIVDVDSEEDEATREVLAALRLWQQGLREDKNGQPWRAAEVVAAITNRAFSEATVNAIKRWAGDQRHWDNDPARTLGYALRAVRDDHKFEPFVLTSRTVGDVARWAIVRTDGVNDDAAAGRGTF